MQGPEQKLATAATRWLTLRARARGDVWFKKIHGSRMQSRTVDYFLCVAGRFVALEFKAMGKDPTPLQERELVRIARAGGYVATVTSMPQLVRLVDHLLQSPVTAPPATGAAPTDAPAT